MSLYDSGVRPHVTNYLREQSEKVRDYGDYWSASSAGYCMRLQIMRRLGVPKVPELDDDQDRMTRVFEAGHIFHEWMQRITKDAGISVAQEETLEDDEIMVRGHFDDLIKGDDGLVLYDYKTAHSRSFDYKKKQPMGHYHTMQLATYLYMMRKKTDKVTEARILSISKDDLRMHETQLEWTPEIEKKIVGYWKTLNGYWKERKMPKCTCIDYDGGFMGKRTAKGKVYNDFFYEDEPCSLVWMEKTRKEWQDGERKDS